MVCQLIWTSCTNSRLFSKPSYPLAFGVGGEDARHRKKALKPGQAQQTVCSVAYFITFLVSGLLYVIIQPKKYILISQGSVNSLVKATAYSRCMSTLLSFVSPAP